MTHGSVQNMIVFGIIGNLYFVQKTDPELHSNYSSIDRKNVLKKLLRDAFKKNAIEYLENIFPNIDLETSLEIISRDSETKNKATTEISCEYFIRICKDNKFNYYPMELIQNGN
jgi:hypothetical protein